MYYDDSYRDGGRFSLSSIVLLVIFVSAAGLILAAIIWRPWSGDETKVTPPVAAEQADPNAQGDASAVDPNAAGSEAVAPEVVTGP